MLQLTLHYFISNVKLEFRVINNQQYKQNQPMNAN